MSSMQWNKRSYTKEEFIKAWNSSESLAEVARRIKSNYSGGGYHIIKNTAKELGLSNGHMWRTHKATKGVPKRTKSLDDILSNKVDYANTSKLKKRLFAEGILKPECSECGISVWRGQPAPLALDHINGIRSDNSRKNLRILCYNCHGQTETFGSKNQNNKLTCICGRKRIYSFGECHHRKEDGSIDYVTNKKTKECFDCNDKIYGSSIRCLKCYSIIKKKDLKIEYPQVNIIIDNIKLKGVQRYAKELGLSDSGLRKHLKRNGVDIIPKKLTKKDMID
jgi:hypothetical protein